MNMVDPLLALPLLAVADKLPGLVASVLVGLSVGGLVWWVLAALRTEDLQQEDEWRYDISRINHLRRLDTSYRMFQPAIQFLARLNRAAFRDQLPEIYREIQAAGLPRYWLPEEYLGRALLYSLLAMPVYFFLVVRTLEAVSAAITASILLSGLTFWWLRYRLKRMAQQRLVLIKRRMPFLLDLLTLLMEAGATFLQALKQAVNEFEGHAVAVEFGRVLTDMNVGKTRTEAFENMRSRLKDDEIGTIVSAIVQGESLGTPMADVFRTQADVLRLKRSQRAETIAGEAGVNMLLPGILIMMACVLVILGPFVLGNWVAGLF
jgi:tight adherence protein C